MSYETLREIENPSVQLKFKCNFCDYESTSQKGVNIHKGSKHKLSKASTESTSPAFSITPSQSPINCILHEEGCRNVVTSYYNSYTAICISCSLLMKAKLESSPFPSDLCCCCHQPSNGASNLFCSECLSSIQVDGYLESTWGSWHLDRNCDKIVCIDLNFD